jgi:hypothetical protein
MRRKNIFTPPVYKARVICADCGVIFRGSVNGWFCAACSKKRLEAKNKKGGAAFDMSFLQIKSNQSS